MRPCIWITRKRLRRPGKSAVPNRYLIISTSARALAASAVKVGFEVWAMDCFADLDTRGLCKKIWQLENGAAFTDEKRLAKVIAQANFDEIDGIVIGSGFEQSPELLKVLPESVRLYSNSVETIEACSKPDIFFPILEQAGINYPEVFYESSLKTGDWLVKKIGANGGNHIRWVSDLESLARDEYQQKYTPGEHYSCSFLANGKESRVLALNKTWCTKTKGSDFNFGGAVYIPGYAHDKLSQLQKYLEKLVPVIDLKGLCGLDFLIHEEKIKVLEINPRPTQTLELIDDQISGLFQAHLDCFDDGQITEFELPGDYSGLQIIYAEEDLIVGEATQWPDWVSNRPGAGSYHQTGMPICTVFARAVSERKVVAELQQRVLDIQKLLKNSFQAKS